MLNMSVQNDLVRKGVASGATADDRMLARRSGGSAATGSERSNCSIGSGPESPDGGRSGCMGGGRVGNDLAEMLHGVAVAAGSGAGGDAEDFRDAGKGEVFPDLEMNHSALFIEQAGEGFGDS